MDLDTFQISTDPDGREFVYEAIDELAKITDLILQTLPSKQECINRQVSEIKNLKDKH